MKSISLFAGYDPREKIGFHVFAESVISRASRLVSITPLAQCGLDSGSNAFTLSRFLVPYICGFKGHAIFVDGSDMLCLSDIAELDSLFDDRYAVQVVKHPTYTSKHERKYVGTSMECAQSNYDRKNWVSCMLLNNAHPAWSAATPDLISRTKPIDLLQLSNLQPGEIGDIPAEWNVLVDEGQESDGAKILHWSSGLPFFSHYQNTERSRDWWDARYKMTDTVI